MYNGTKRFLFLSNVLGQLGLPLIYLFRSRSAQLVGCGSDNPKVLIRVTDNGLNTATTHRFLHSAFVLDTMKACSSEVRTIN